MGLPGREGQGLGKGDGGQERVRWRDVRGRKKNTRAEACVCLLVVVLVDRIVENGAQRKAPSRESFWFQASCLPGPGGKRTLRAYFSFSRMHHVAG
jgi:hypothetical protein